MKQRKTLLHLLLLILLSSSFGGDSCCKLHQQQKQEFIDDPNDTIPPSEFQGQPRFIPNPNDIRPDEWDEEDDGPWEPNLIENPTYEWKPRKIRNPNYHPPPTFHQKLLIEIEKAIPWVTLGILITGIATLCLSLQSYQYIFEQWKKYFQSSALMAAILGLATPLCSCGALPVAIGFWDEGMPPQSVVSFLTASQSAGIDSAAITYGLLGPVAVFSRLIGALILAIATGFSVNVSYQDTKIKSKAIGVTPKQQAPTNSRESGFQLLLFTLLDSAVEVFPSFILGLVLSTAIVQFIPSLLHPNFENVAKEEGYSIVSILIRWSILASALPLQLCEHSTVALAAAIQKAGGSPGLGFGFLLSAPATNLPTLLLLMKKMSLTTVNQAKLLIRMGLVISGTAMVLSYVVDFLNMDLLVEEEARSSANPMSLPHTFVIVSPWLASLLYLSGVARNQIDRYKTPKHGQFTKESCCGGPLAQDVQVNYSKKNY